MAPERGAEWNIRTVPVFAGTFDTHIKDGADYDTVTLADIFTREPGNKAKGSGQAFIPSSYADYDAREHAAQRERGAYVALVGDVDHGNHSQSAIIQAVQAFAGPAACLIYSSAHARDGDMRWRIILPLDAPQTFIAWHDAQSAFFAFMEARGIKMDHALARAAQPVYLPNVPPVHAKTGTPLRGEDGAALYYKHTATPLTAPGLNLDAPPVAEGIAAIRQRRAEDECQREAIRKASETRRAAKPRGVGASVIDDFNAANAVATMLEICGYTQSPRDPDDWRSPHQTSDSYATRIFDSKWVSLSTSDASAGVGEQCKAGRFGDAYDLYSHYKHGGDHKAVYRALSAEQRGNNVIYPAPPERLAETPAHDEYPGWDAGGAEHGAPYDGGEADDLLEGLLEKTANDPGSPFTPEVLERLAVLKKEDRAGFETLRSNLKKAGCRVTALDEAIAEESGDAGGRRPTQADIMIDLAQSAELFHTPDSTGYADIDVNGHRETWQIRSRGFRRWLARAFFEETQGAPSSEALQSTLNVIEAKAHFDAPERVVNIRVGGLDGRLYLDLSDETWRAVEIDATGWRVIDNPPVRFRRAAGMKPLPLPTKGGSIDTLRSFLNLQSDDDFVLVVAWALAVLRNRGPYPVIVLSGEQGSAKSTFSSILRAVLDPNTAPLRALPREDRDLFIAATNGHVLAFDNVSSLPAWISDTLCRLATGGGFAVRQLYSDSDEVLFDAARPVILNGIEEIVTRPDLADRAVFLTLEPIPEESRRPEAELWEAFNAECPRILGVLLDAVAEGLKRLPDTRLEKLPRMADFALWVTACETALWPAGTFWSAYCDNRDEAVEGVIDADPVAAGIRTLMTTRTEWTGTASDLLGALGEMVGERAAKSKTWPDSPRALSGRCRRAATFLRKIGIEICFGREGRARTRTITITINPTQTATENKGFRPSAPSASSALTQKANPANDLAAVPLRTVATDADGRDQSADGRDQGTVRANPLKPNDWTGADGADANNPPQSGPDKPDVAGWSGRI